MLVNRPLLQTIREIGGQFGLDDPLGIDDDGIASTFALAGQHDDLPLLRETSQWIGGATISGFCWVIVASMIEVDLAKAAPGFSFIVRDRNVECVASTVNPLS